MKKKKKNSMTIRPGVLIHVVTGCPVMHGFHGLIISCHQQEKHGAIGMTQLPIVSYKAGLLESIPLLFKFL